MRLVLRGSSLLLALVSGSALFGCAHYEVNTGRGNIPGQYIRYELQEADRAVEAARSAGKDRSCPAEFAQAEAAKNNAYDVFRACRTEEGAALAKLATGKANALCPPVAAKPVEAPAPVPAAPTDKLSVAPDSITKGEAAMLSWTSSGATACEIEPGIGPVALEGSMPITPGDSTAYTLICSGAGGSARSQANVKVTARPVVVAPVPAAPMVAVVQPAAPAEPVKHCKPAVIDIRFDTNKADIKPEYHGELKALADFLAEFKGAKGVISGHTDSVGDKAANMKLSQRRADSVRNYLVNKFGVAPERIKAVGYGPTKPIASNGTKEGKQKNRRIESDFTCDSN